MTAAGALARAGIIVSGAFLVSRVLGYVRLVVIGNTFGATADLDAFFAAFRIPDLIFQLVAAGALSSALIPVISALFTTGEQARAWRVVSTVINLMLIGLAVLAVGFFILAPVIVPIITPGFEGAQLDTTIELTRIMLLSPIFLALGAVATSVLNAGGRFAAAADGPDRLQPRDHRRRAVLLAPTLGVDGLALGVVAGSLGHLLVQVRPLARLGFRYDAADRRQRPAGAQGADADGAARDRARRIADHVHRGDLAGDRRSRSAPCRTSTSPSRCSRSRSGSSACRSGSCSCRRSRATRPLGHETGFADLLTRALRLLVYVMVPISVLAAVSRVPIVEILFGNGKILPEDLELIAVTLTAFLVGLTAHALIAVLARAFYARQDTVTPVVAAVAAVAINCTLAIILVGPYGLPGIALAIATAAWIEALALLAILVRRLHHFELRGLARVGVESVVGSVVAGVIAYAVLAFLTDRLGVDPAGSCWSPS